MQFDLLPTLENELVKIRPLLHTEFEALYAVANDPLIWDQHWAPDRHKKSVFRKYFDDAINNKHGLVIIDKTTGDLIGSSRFKPVSTEPKAVEIGWTFLSRKYWGGRYNRSFKSLMIDYAFKQFEYVMFYVAGENNRSKKAVMKLGGDLVSQESDPTLYRTMPNYSSFKLTKAAWLKYNNTNMNY